MIFTEEEARKKWCPFSRQAVVVSRDPVMAATANRDCGEHYGAENCNCIASDCMAWRKMSDAYCNGEDGDGFCGLAGQP